jgi:drug/metabolite transporter (DMT)-like permease
MELSSTAVALVLSAALCHALWNLALKKVGNPSIGFVGMIATLETLVWIPAVLLAANLDRILTIKGLLAVTVSALLHIAYFWLLAGAYKKNDLGIAYPIARATGPLLSGIFAIVVLLERPSSTEIFGAITIICGSLFIGLSQGKTIAAESIWGNVRLAVFCGVAIAAYTVWDQHAVSTWELPVVAFYWGQLLVRAVVCSPWFLRDKNNLGQQFKTHWKSLLAIAILSPLAYQLVLQAMTIAPLSLVAPLRETSILFAIILGSLFLKEQNTGRRMFGAGLMLVGLITLTF